MKEAIQRHLLSELERTSKGDMIFVVGAVMFNIMCMFIAWNNMSSPYRAAQTENIVIAGIFIAASVIGTILATRIIIKGSDMCIKYNEALLNIYRDTDVIKYFPDGTLKDGKERRLLNISMLLLSCGLVIVLPLVQVLLQP